jgi:PAS domain S-box-containing protein
MALRQTQEVLRDTGDHLRKLIQYASAPIIVWNPEFVITRFNRAFEQLTGYLEGEVVGHPLSVLFPRESWSETFSLIEQSRGGLQWEAVEIPIRRKTGELRIALWNSANIYAADAVTLTAVIAQGQDITERVRREQEAMRDAKLATRVQNALLPVPEPSEYLEIATVYNPFGYVGGDLYFLDWRYDERLLRGFIVDATGHGLGTALHTASLHVLLREVNERDIPLVDAMRWLNRRAGEYFAEGIFAGALGFELDLETRQLRWVCAGIPEVWLAAKARAGVVQCPGMCLGIMEEETFELHTLPVEVGDSFYFMTDGLSDLLDKQSKEPLIPYPKMVGLLRKLSESETRRDDATAVCIQVRALPLSLVREDGWPRILRFSGYGDYRRLKGEVAKILAEVTGLPHSLHEVAVNEALANAMECRDGVPRQHKARLRFNKVGNRFIVRVRTSRLEFAGNAILRRLRSHPEEMFSFGEDASMGRGIPLMLSLSHKMTYNSEGTEVLLAWKL